MDEIATEAATGFCSQYEADAKRGLSRSPEKDLEHSIPYLTVRTPHRHEKALKSLEIDSRWIKFLTVVLVALTIVLAIYALRLDAVIHSLQKTRPAVSNNPTSTPTMAQ